MTALSWIISILGLVATIIGCCLAIFTFINPLVRLKHYLKKVDKWEKVYVDRHVYNWRYKKHPEFSIEIDEESKEWSRTEDWMNTYPDTSKSSSLVKMRVNGQVLLVEEFISLDGGRYFVPVPKRIIIRPQNKPEYFFYWYTHLQINLARIIGSYYREKTIEEFMKNHRLQVEELKEV